MAWTAPAIVLAVAVPAAAASGDAMVTIVITPNANADQIDAIITLPDGVVLTNIVVNVVWRSQANDAYVQIAPEALSWQPSDISEERDAWFSALEQVDGSGTLTVTIYKGQKGPDDNDDFTVTVSAYDATHDKDVTATLTADYLA
jgi:hypothetical protein